MSDAWTGFTRFILLNERPPDGYTWSGRRLAGQGAIRPEGLEGPEGPEGSKAGEGRKGREPDLVIKGSPAGC